MENGYKCFYKGQTVNVYAENPLQARNQAQALFQARTRRKVKGYDIAPVLCELGGEQVTHSTSEI